MKTSSLPYQQHRIRRGLTGLQMRMAISYVVANVASIMFIELVFFIVITIVILNTDTPIYQYAPGKFFSLNFTNLINGIPGLFTEVFFLSLFMSPAAVVFGMVTMRGPVKRIHHLVAATARFASGDYTQRVPVKKRDEIGQLESQFNTMATQLVESIEQQRILTEQSARLEERARIEQELHTARQIQRSLLPKKMPSLVGWQLSSYYQPAREVGGDFFDFFSFPDGRLGLVIGDVADKGIPAAMVMASTRSLLHAAADVTHSPAEILTRVNDLLFADTPTKMFVTCFIALLDPVSGKLCFSNAGHDLPYRHSKGQVQELYARGMPLGLFPGSQYDEHEIQLAPGESLLFYSDGMVEAHNPQKEMFGFPRMQQSIERNNDSATLINDLLHELKLFTGNGWEQEDDMTFVTLQRTGVFTMPEESGDTTQPQQLLLDRRIASVPGNEQQAMEEVGNAVLPLHLPLERLDNLKTAVAEAVMNAMEHGNHYQPDSMVYLQVLTTEKVVTVRIGEQGQRHTTWKSAQDISAGQPDIFAKLAGQQSVRGWGLFLIQNLVDEVRTHEDEHHTIELLLYRNAEDISKDA